MKSELTQADLRRMFDYREDGELVFRSDLGPYYVKHAGKVAGHVASNGYRYIRVMKRLYLAHHLVWMWNLGRWPTHYGMDHIDRNPLNNRMDNLRDMPFSINMSNRRQLRRDMLTGVYPARGKNPNRWEARIKKEGSNGNRKLGVYDSQEEAHQAFQRAHIERFGAHSQYFKG